MTKSISIWAFCLLAVLAAPPSQAADRSPSCLREAVSPAWSLRASQREMIVSVSPVRQTVQLFSSSAMLLGAGIDAMVNEKHLKAVRAALGDYDAGKTFEEALTSRLSQALPQGLARVSPLTTTAGFKDDREAQQARFQGLARSGHDVLLDLKMTYGIFGYEGLLVARIEGRLTRLADRRALWSGVFVVSADPVLANTTIKDPTKQMGANLAHPRLTVEKDAVARWTGDGGATIRARFEDAVDGAVSALLCGLGLATEAKGEYQLGLVSMGRKRFTEADEHFRRAISLNPAWPEPRNARAVNLARNKQIDDAMAICAELTKSHPDFGPAWFNLAWWNAVQKKDAATARPLYEKALALGMPADPKLDRLLLLPR
ncbi:MAG TPA: hypothetical protein P5318_07310 [Candidatus Hydrogenedentes bacterium]|nr:hypothetical protein [Candidatus Hydrogenedentota bacterium]HRT19924.1 hypothetical protein [Candidatus Hydrogenedentota bacterium]HRT66353.1 hypothetical protein [Candidatus Hydrogenedentota bacterium]